MRHWVHLGLLLAFTPLAPAQTLSARVLPASGGPAGLAFIVAAGSRPWEEVRRQPLVVDLRDAGGVAGETLYFMLDSEDLDPAALQPPDTVREKAFVAEVEREIEKDGRSPWPVFVLAAPDRLKRPWDVTTMASTRRIAVRDAEGTFHRAAAILLNSAYWGVEGLPLDAHDHAVTTLVARHEMYHARRAWLRAGEIAAHADAIDGRLQAVGAQEPGRAGLESLVAEGLAAREEMAAVDWSLHSSLLPDDRRRGVLEYREANRQRGLKTIKALLKLFPDADARGRRTTERWLTDLMAKTLGAAAAPLRTARAIR